MAQILTTIEDNSLVAPLLSVIKKLRGVTRTSVYEGEVSELSKEQPSVHKHYSSRIQRLKGVARDITQEQIENDERLKYMLSK